VAFPALAACPRSTRFPRNASREATLAPPAPGFTAAILSDRNWQAEKTFRNGGCLATRAQAELPRPNAHERASNCCKRMAGERTGKGRNSSRALGKQSSCEYSPIYSEHARIFKNHFGQHKFQITLKSESQ
jgi:hypothetical protein